MAAKKLRCGVPKGSLNTLNSRANTQSLWQDAGYDIRGYTPGSEQSDKLRIANDSEIELFVSRPQNFPGDLDAGLLDIAITGKDWVREESSVTRPLQELADLEYGQVRIVLAVQKDSGAGNLTEFFLSRRDSTEPILCYSEYTKLARDCILQNPGYRQIFGSLSPIAKSRSGINGDNERVQIIYTDGGTEEYIKMGVDMVVDNTDSGKSLETVGAKILEEIMTSSAGLYARPDLQDDAWKWGKASEIKDKLFGVTVARKYDDVKFNIDSDKRDAVIEYILKEGLARKAPTAPPLMGPGGSLLGYAMNVVVPKVRWPEVSTVLKRDYGATAITRSDLKQLIM